jgi:hypothetical protein
MTNHFGHKALAIGALAVGLAVASAAQAASPRACQDGDVTPTAITCQGWFSGNLLGGSLSDRTQAATDLNTLLGVNTFTASNDGGLVTLQNLNGATTINFGQTLFGDTVIAFHNGAAKGENNNIGAEGTAFFLIDFLTPVTSFVLNVPGSSNARLYSTGSVTKTGGVPESASWTLLVLGMGVLGAGLRMRRSPAMAAVG